MATPALHDFYKRHQFKPTDEEVVAGFLPRLLAGQKHMLIHDADVYACEPKDLAAAYPPIPGAISTGDRFFFTTCGHKNGQYARVAGAGTWTVEEMTKNVYSKGVKVGEVTKLSFWKGNVPTGWVMEEYRGLLPQAAVPGVGKVLCKIHLAQHAPAAAHQESAAYKVRLPQHAPAASAREAAAYMLRQETVAVTAQKRPAPVAAADLSSCKKMRVAAPVAIPGPEDDFYKFHKFKPTKEEAVTHFLPLLLAGATLGNADKHIHDADVYACEPKDLAAKYPPVRTAASTGDRFFVTTCKGKKGGKNRRCARVAGAGTWTVNNTEDVYNKQGVKAGELTKLSFKKNRVATGWVMEEYRCLLPEAVVAEGEKVLCKIHLAPKAPSAAREESAAYKLCQEPAEPPVPQPKPVTGSTHVHKSQAQVSLPASSTEEKYEDCPAWSTEVPAAPEADDYMDDPRMSCSYEELFPDETGNNNGEELVFNEDMDQVDVIEAGNNNVNGELVSNEDMEQLDPVDWEPLDIDLLLADLQAPSLQVEGYTADLQVSFAAVN